jgi:hypothetical protein
MLGWHGAPPEAQRLITDLLTPGSWAQRARLQFRASRASRNFWAKPLIGERSNAGMFNWIDGKNRRSGKGPNLQGGIEPVGRVQAGSTQSRVQPEAFGNNPGHAEATSVGLRTPGMLRPMIAIGAISHGKMRPP